MDSSGLLTRKIVSSLSGDHFTSFQFGSLFFLFGAYLLWLRLPSCVEWTGWEWASLPWSRDLRGKVPRIGQAVGRGAFACGTHRTEVVGLCSQCVYCSYHRRCCILSNAFSASVVIVRSSDFFPFLRFMRSIVLVDFRVLNYPCIPGLNPTGS